MSTALPLIEQVLVLSPPSIVFVAFAAVLTGAFNARLALLTEVWGTNIGTLAQKKAYLNSPETKIKDNIRKRHERYVRNLEYSTRTIQKHLHMIRAGTYMVLISFLLFVISTMLSVLKPYNITLAYPATIILWAGMLLDVIAVLLIFIDLWTSYSHLQNENMLLYKIKRMIIQDFRATGQLPPDNGEQMEEPAKPDADEASLHDEINQLVLKNAQFGPEAENEMKLQKAEVAITLRNIQTNGQNGTSNKNDRAVEEQSSESSTSSQPNNNDIKLEQVEKPADSETTSSSEEQAPGSDKVSRSSSASEASSSSNDSSASQDKSNESSS